MTDPAAQLAFLRAQRAAATDPAARAMFDTLIASLEAQQPKYQWQDAPPPARSHIQQIGGYAQVGVAVAGSVHGHIYLYGKRTASNAELIRAYLNRQIQRCDTLPLQGVYEQRAGSDVLRIGLELVYTECATTALTQRELLNAPALATFDATTYREQHVGDLLLPSQQRVLMQRTARRPLFDAGLAPLAVGAPDHDGDITSHAALDQITVEALTRAASAAEQLVFAGPQLVSEAIAASPRLVLLGEPGSGKSTVLRYLALILARAGLDQQIDRVALLAGWDSLGDSGSMLPIFLPLLAFARYLGEHPGQHGSADDLWNFIAAQLEGGGRYEGLAAAVHEELLAGRVLLLLDGLDEVVGTTSRHAVVHAVHALAQQYPARIVVTCRVRAYEGQHNHAWQLPGWPTATLADWNLGQVTRFVDAWYSAVAVGQMAAEKREERRAALQQAIRAREDLQRLGVRPLLLTIMALVHLNDGKLPEERVGLYSRCVNLLLGQWELAREDGSGYGTLMDFIGLPNADTRSLRPLLQAAALRAHAAGGDTGRGALARDTLYMMVGEALARRGHTNPWDGAARFLEYTDVRAGLLQASDAGDAYAFPHQTFQEYLAGLELVGGVEFVQQIMQRRHDDRWRVPIMLGIGHLVSEGALAMPHQVLTELLVAEGRTAVQCQHDALFAAEIAADVGWERLEQSGASFKKVRRDLAAALAQVVEGTLLPAAERVRAGVLLGELGDPRPGVCGLPPAMVTFVAGDFGIGITRAEYHAIVKQEKRSGLEQAARDWYKDSINSATTRVARFALARYPVTNAQYALFIADGGYDPGRPWWDAASRAWLARDDAATEGLERWQIRTTKREPEYWRNGRYGQHRPNHPVVGVTWYEAMAFCRWLTLHLHDGFVYTLPSEAEWEYAARGAARRVYPWGDAAPDAERANFGGAYDGATPVGSFPAGATPEGLLDMAGNAWEWTRSEYRRYPYDPDDGRENVAEPARKHFTLRGGSWNLQSAYLRAAFRSYSSPGPQPDLIGFRLARHLPV